jgi:hypothetical protein
MQDQRTHRFRRVWCLRSRNQIETWLSMVPQTGNVEFEKRYRLRGINKQRCLGFEETVMKTRLPMGDLEFETWYRLF